MILRTEALKLKSSKKTKSLQECYGKMWDLKRVKKAGQVPMGTDKQLMNNGDRPNLEKSNWKY